MQSTALAKRLRRISEALSCPTRAVLLKTCLASPVSQRGASGSARAETTPAKDKSGYSIGVINQAYQYFPAVKGLASLPRVAISAHEDNEEPPDK